MLSSKLSSKNLGRKDNKKEILAALKKSMHLSKGEHALLSCYAFKAAGSSPTIDDIEKELMLSRRAILKIKRSLIDDGLIDVSKNSITLDWSRLKTLASLDPAMTGKHCGCCTNIRNKYDFADTNMMSIPQLIDRLARMTEQENAEFRKYVRQNAQIVYRKSAPCF